MRVLFFSTTTGYQASEFRRAAQRSGVPLVLVSNRCHVLEDPWRDGAIPVRLEAPEESARHVAEYARKNPVAGIVAAGDPITLVAALTARELGLPFHPPEAVEVCRNKYAARERCRAAGLPVPWYIRFPASDAPPGAGVRFPCVLKPLGLSGSRGVIRADDPEEFRAAFERIRKLLAGADVQALRDEAAGWIQVEGYLPGREFALEGIVTAGRLRVLAIFEKPDPLEGPFFEETIYVTPPRLEPAAHRAVVETAERAVAAVGLRHGPVHAEVRVNPDGVWMLEMAARPIGGLCARALRFQGGVSLEEFLLRHALGEDVSGLQREDCASGVMMIPIPRAGVLEGVDHLDAALSVPGIESAEITAQPGERLVPLPEGSSYLGFLFARARTPDEVERALRQAHSKLRFRIRAALPVVRATPWS